MGKEKSWQTRFKSTQPAWLFWSAVWWGCAPVLRGVRCPCFCGNARESWQFSNILLNKSITDTQGKIQAQTPEDFQKQSQMQYWWKKEMRGISPNPWHRLCVLDGVTREETGREREKDEEKGELMLSLCSITSEISGVVGSFSHPKSQKTALTMNTFYWLLISPLCLSRRMENTLYITAVTQ